MATSNTSKALEFYSGWIALLGSPPTITTDRGRQFEAALFTSMAELMDADRIRTMPYHPQSNGMVEL